jgi:aryl-alcohol dehydrogenase-like predicted oxidoreductase
LATCESAVVRSRVGPRSHDVPLILGGHSFIHQLGNDAAASEAEQEAIVAACLDHGVRWFDTTYQPERIALGKALHALGRRGEATILAWNFFADFTPSDPVGTHAPYRPGHIDMILEQLRTDFVDCLVLVPVADHEENQRQIALLEEWRTRGHVRSLGVWVEDTSILTRQRAGHPFRFAIRPFNVTTADAASVFADCKIGGWETIATSPFFRGWELDRMVAGAAKAGYGDAQRLRATLADALLRFALFQDGVGRVVVAMRKVEWVTRNVESVDRGPLTPKERRWLLELRRRTLTKPWWRRLLRRS